MSAQSVVPLFLIEEVKRRPIPPIRPSIHGQVTCHVKILLVQEVSDTMATGDGDVWTNSSWTQLLVRRTSSAVSPL